MTQVRQALAEKAHRPVVIGLCGSQGSGKTTLAAAVLEACRAQDLRCAVLSIDDIYLTRAEREDLADRVHPLFATRGVPGTHDVALGLAVIAALERGEASPLPRFDKSCDDREPTENWPAAPADCEVLLLEGWCVGASAQPPVTLVRPVNALESEEDPDAIWRSFANAALAGGYAELFARIDRLVLLAAPDFAVVRGWRLQQEEELAARLGAGAQVMSAPEIARFVSHYERLTRHILAEMPDRANLIVRLDAARRPIEITALR
ncbi:MULTISPECIES: zeta toxin family protein [unclassified Novosphingobium]|uniref:zeta toxin family protein n=1 Tax=unclassified Novosphingobium TaxID=2644732 RepID=UPI001357DA16|nr:MULTISPECIES: zeta toxin family protein [unclassified Novosphingobium]